MIVDDFFSWGEGGLHGEFDLEEGGFEDDDEFSLEFSDIGDAFRGLGMMDAIKVEDAVDDGFEDEISGREEGVFEVFFSF